MKKTLNVANLPKGILIGAGLSMAFVMSMTVSVPLAKAITPNILTGVDMSVGSTGENVVVLQGLLSETGYLVVPMGIPLGYYGEMTRSAVARYQSALGVAPTAGYFGPATKSSMRNDYSSRNWLRWLAWQ